MGFSFKKAVGGGVSGALFGGAVGGVPGAIIGAGAGGLLNGLFGGGDPTTVSQGPLETPEQAIARQQLLKFAQSGTYGGYTAGANYNAPLGDFTPTSQESLGLGKLNDLLLAGRPDVFNQGQQALSDLLSPTSRFDPYSSTGEFAPFLAASNREFGVDQNTLKRNLSMQGNLFSTDTARQFSDLTAQHGEQVNSKLASLYSDYINQKINAIPEAANYAQAGQNLDLGLVGASQQYGSLSRLLNTQGDQASYQDFLRKQTELKDPLNALTSISGQNVPFGPSSVTLPATQGPFDSILNLLAQFGGQYAGAKAGAKASAKV